MQAQTIFFLKLIKLIKCRLSADNAVPSDPCVGPSPRITISFFYYYQSLEMNSCLL